MGYDPFATGPFPVDHETHNAEDRAREKRFTYDLWFPAAGGTFPLIAFSHFSGGTRSASTFICKQLASHGYLVGALDHSDSQLPRPSDGKTDEEKITRLQAWIDARVPDIRFLIDTLAASDDNVGLVGHSFGGWTVLAAPTDEPRIASVVALAPAGSRNPRPGVIPAPLDFEWRRTVPTLIIAGDRDVSIPLDHVRDIFDRAPEPKKLVALRGVDHMHFVDGAEAAHERVRSMQFPPELAWLRQEIRPFSELRPEQETHECIRGLTLAHFDATLKGNPEARDFLEAYPELA